MESPGIGTNTVNTSDRGGFPELKEKGVNSGLFEISEAVRLAERMTRLESLVLAVEGSFGAFKSDVDVIRGEFGALKQLVASCLQTATYARNVAENARETSTEALITANEAFADGSMSSIRLDIEKVKVLLEAMQISAPAHCEQQTSTPTRIKQLPPAYISPSPSPSVAPTTVTGQIKNPCATTGCTVLIYGPHKDIPTDSQVGPLPFFRRLLEQYTDTRFNETDLDSVQRIKYSDNYLMRFTRYPAALGFVERTGKYPRAVGATAYIPAFIED